MSILELISAAEQKAEAMRQNANEQVKSLLETTRNESEEEAKALHIEAEKEIKDLEAKFDNEIQKKQLEVEKKAIAEDEVMIKAAKKQYPEAIDFILKKVVVK